MPFVKLKILEYPDGDVEQFLGVVVAAVWCARGWPRRGRKAHTTFSYLVYVV